MATVARITNTDDTEVSFVFDCPACGIGHSFRVEGEGPKWSFNGDVDKPTFSPSLLVKWGKSGKMDQVCHSFVRDGQMQFLSDCTHEMAGKTITLPETDWGDD